MPDRHWTVGAKKYAAAASEVTVPAGRRLTLPVTTSPTVKSSESGLLLLYGNGKRHDFQSVPLGGS